MLKMLLKKLLGPRYERAGKAVLASLLLWLGLRSADLDIRIGTPVLYLMSGAFTAGVMWQALVSDSNQADMKHLLMLPFTGRKLMFSCVGALGTYTLLTRTGLLWAVILAVSDLTPAQAAGSFLCALQAVLTAAAVCICHSLPLGLVWAAELAAAIFLAGRTPFFWPLMAGNLILTLAMLWKGDPYALLRPETMPAAIRRGRRRHSVRRYFFRYLASHKNYLFNTAAMDIVACVLPVMFGQAPPRFALPLGFAILSLNTPLCILLSCDPSLERAVRFLPGQKKAFLLPYCLFLFVCFFQADLIFLASWALQKGGIRPDMAAMAVYFSMQSALGSVLLEWYCPLRNWKIESDLWHHPRKYVVPAGMMVIAGAVSTWPGFLWLLLPVLLAEGILLLR